jgi:hypothetical protein
VRYIPTNNRELVQTMPIIEQLTTKLETPIKNADGTKKTDESGNVIYGKPEIKKLVRCGGMREFEPAERFVQENGKFKFNNNGELMRK